MSSENSSNESTYTFIQSAIKQIYPQYNHEEFLQLLDNQPTINYAFGAFMGFCIGDYLGSACQFSQQLSEKDVFRVLTMKSSDSSITSAKLSNNSQIVLNLIKGIEQVVIPDSPLKEQTQRLTINIGSSYVNWYKENPQDITVTMSQAMKILSSVKLSRCLLYEQEKIENVLKILFEEIQKKNINSLTNGCMVRSTGSAFFLSLFETSSQEIDAQKFIENEVRLTHSNKKIIAAQRIWAQVLKKVIQRSKSSDESGMGFMLSECKKLKLIYEEALDFANKNSLQDWVNAVNNPKLVQTTIKQCRAEISWELGLITLEKLSKMNKYDLKGSDVYRAHIKEILQKGGDTCANAGVVGGLLGGVLGFKELPQSYISKMMSKRSEKKADQQLKNISEPRQLFIQAWKLLKKIRKI